MHRFVPSALHLFGCALAGMAAGGTVHTTVFWGLLGIGAMAIGFHLRGREHRELQRTISASANGIAHQERLATVGTLAASVVHDIRNMLTSLRGNLELAQESDTLDTGQAECLADALLAAHRIQHLTTALNSYARPHDSQARSVEDLQQIVEEAIRLVRPLARKGPALIVVPHEPAWVAHAPGQLQQIFVNLLQNAISIIGPRRDGEVRICVEANDTSGIICARITDNGPGIARPILERLFQPFATSRPRSGGTGLGLFTSRRLARQCGGDLSARNRPEGGAEFVLTLPAAQAPPPRTEQAPEPQDPSHASTPSPHHVVLHVHAD